MNKKFYLALVATAALFASCSSDDIAEAPSMQPIDDSAKAPIVINVANLGSTRGTGTVGGTTAANAQWAGQKFNLFMFDKKTFNLSLSGGNPIFNDAEFTTPVGAGHATYNVLGVDQYTYFPTTGSYHFWAYRVDDAWLDGANLAGYEAGADPTTKQVVGVGDATATKVTVPFKIDGSQDLMIGIADTANALTTLQATDAEATQDLIYSAYAARRGVTTDFKFKHLLSRFTFYVIANERSVSEAADAPFAGAAALGWQPGFRVTGVTIKSKSKGNIIAAYKGELSGAGVQADRIDWNNPDGTASTEDWTDKTTLATFNLKSRQKEVDEAAVWAAPAACTVGAAAADDYSFVIPATYDFDGSGAVAVYNAGLTVTATATAKFYDSDQVDATTGLPSGNLITKAEAAANGIATLYYFVAKDGVRADVNGVDVPYTKPTYTNTVLANADLKDLDVVVPQWTGYTVTPATYKATDASATYANEAALDAAILLDPSIVKIGSGDAAALDAAKIAANEGHYFVNTDDNKVYLIEEDQAAVVASEGNAVPTQVGEALFVAPNESTTAADNGYEVVLTYERDKKLTAATLDLAVQDVVNLTVQKSTTSGGVTSYQKFEPGKSYKVTVRLYGDGEFKDPTVTIDPDDQWDEEDMDEFSN